MFYIGIIQENDDAQYMSVKSMFIVVDAIVEHIRLLQRPGRRRQERHHSHSHDVCDLVSHRLMGVKAERDGNNMCLESDAPLVLPAQLIAIRHGKFVSEVLEPYCDHISAFWSLNDVDQTEADHRDLLNFYASD
jgi:hypothetical protein